MWCARTHSHIYTYTHTNAHIHTHTHTHTHLYIYTHTHTHTNTYATKPLCGCTTPSIRPSPLHSAPALTAAALRHFSVSLLTARVSPSSAVVYHGADEDAVGHARSNVHRPHRLAPTRSVRCCRRSRRGFVLVPSCICVYVCVCACSARALRVLVVTQCALCACRSLVCVHGSLLVSLSLLLSTPFFECSASRTHFFSHRRLELGGVSETVYTHTHSRKVFKLRSLKVRHSSPTFSSRPLLSPPTPFSTAACSLPFPAFFFFLPLPLSLLGLQHHRRCVEPARQRARHSHNSRSSPFALSPLSLLVSPPVAHSHSPSSFLQQEILLGDAQGSVFEMEINGGSERAAKKAGLLPLSRTWPRPSDRTPKPTLHTHTHTRTHTHTHVQTAFHF